MSWKYVHASIAGMCRRRILLDNFSEESTTPNTSGECCDVCQQEMEYTDYKEFFLMLYSKLDVRVKLRLQSGSGDQRFHGQMLLTRNAYHMEIIEVRTITFGELYPTEKDS